MTMGKNRNLILAGVAVVLFILSLWAYRSSVVGAERFDRGQRFLPNLNPDEVATISLAKGEDEVVLERGEEEFTIVSKNDYPAKNEAVNRLLRDVLEIELDKEVGSDESLYEELGLVPGGDDAVEVELADSADKSMVHFVVGKRHEGGAGVYLRRLDDDSGMVYLTSKGLVVNPTAANFIKKELLDVKAEDIDFIQGRDFRVAEDDGELRLEGVPAGREVDTAAMNRAKGVLSYLNFAEVYLADDPEVAGLSFEQRLQVQLKDGSGYNLAVATRGEDTFLQISGYHTVQALQVERDETEEELQEKAEVMKRANEISQFNDLHGSWVYKVNTGTAEKLALTRSDLLKQTS